MYTKKHRPLTTPRPNREMKIQNTYYYHKRTSSNEQRTLHIFLIKQWCLKKRHREILRCGLSEWQNAANNMKSTSRRLRQSTTRCFF